MLVKSVAAVSVAIAAYFISTTLRGTTDSSGSGGTSAQQSTQPISANLSSSVWCQYDKTLNKICVFRDICYAPKASSFLFLLTKESIISGLNDKNDFKTISLSSVEKHNNLFMKLQIVIDFDKRFGEYQNNVVLVNEPILLVSRFKPDNIMHVIHDDILPVFTTYDSLCHGNIFDCVRRYRIMFTDNGEYVKHIEWYKMLSNKMPYSLENLNEFTCFNEVVGGLSRETLWFQYGFGMHQGPLLSSRIDSLTINRFKNFVLDHFHVDQSSDSDVLDVVFLSRKHTRRILNENFIVNEITQVCSTMFPQYKGRIKVHVMDPSQNRLIEMISVAVRSRLLVGMHGSAMILALFLPNDAAIVELFPFGIQPQHVSSTRALSQRAGTTYSYLSWRNFKEGNSIGHRDWPPLLGGFNQLSGEEQQRILSLKEIPAVECCHDPAYLYRMFQDTYVDEHFPTIVKQALINQKETGEIGKDSLLNDYLKNTWFLPGPVSNISCLIDSPKHLLSITWNKPFNVETSNSDSWSSYYVTVKILARIVTLETLSSTVSVKLSAEEVHNTSIKSNGVQVWIRFVRDDIKGLETHSYC